MMHELSGFMILIGGARDGSKRNGCATVMDMVQLSDVLTIFGRRA